MQITSEQLQAFSATEHFLRRMTTWALPPDVRSELDRLLAAYAGLSRPADIATPAAPVLTPSVDNLSMSSASNQTERDRPFPGNLRERLPEWVASGPDECPATPIDIDQALERIKVVGCQTSWHWFDERDSELGGLQPSGAIEFFDGAEALRQMLWLLSNSRWNGDEPVRRVAFLDVDGVLYPNGKRAPKSFGGLRRRVRANEAVAQLVECLDSVGMDVVLHSHWRNRLTRTQILELLGMADGGFGGKGGCCLCSSGSFLVGTTLSTLDGAAGIKDAVARMRLGADDYIVIDTAAEVLAAFSHQAVPCDASRGIDDAFVIALYERLGVRLVIV